jgi:DNA-binding response OmpR family regulator
MRDEVTFDGICVDLSGREVTRDGQRVVLTAEKFKILSFFLRNEDRDISRNGLLGEALQHHDYSSLRTVDNHILKLRHFHTADGTG